MLLWWAGLDGRLALQAARLLACRSGNFGIGVAAALGPMVLGVAMAVDATNMNRERARLQAALDAAAMEIALSVTSGASDAALQSMGQSFLVGNLASHGGGGLQAPTLRYLGMSSATSGRMDLNAEASADYEYLVPHGFFSGNDGSATIYVVTRISSTYDDAACIYALNHTAARALEVAGNTTVTMEGCLAVSNSSAANAVYVGGSGKLDVDCIQTAGLIAATSGLVTHCPQNRQRAWRMPDPFEDLVEPVPPELKSNPKNNDTVVEPGRYSNLTLQGTKHLEPGLYYVEGKLDIKGDITGTDVTIFMANGGITVNGNASINLTGPTDPDHPYAGMLFWSSKSSTASHKFNGTGVTDLNGFLYFPKSSIDYSGNNSNDETCMRIVADTIVMTGNSKVKVDCTEELGGREARVAGPLHFSR